MQNINNMDYYNSSSYQNFLKNMPGKGNLKIRAYAASEALPVEGLKIIVSGIISGEKVVFFEGVTDTSGMIETIVLPAPILDTSNLVIPLSMTYKIEAISNDLKHEFDVNMYDGICVVQNINFIPGGVYGS